MKTYSIKNNGKSKVAASLATQLEPGRAGEILIRNGFSQDSFCAFLADFATRAVAAGHSKPQLATAFSMLAAGNASQARQACSDISISVDGGKEMSLSSFWGKTETGAKPDLTLLGI